MNSSPDAQAMLLLREAWSLRQRDHQACLAQTQEAEQLADTQEVQGYVLRNKGYYAFCTGDFPKTLQHMLDGREIAIGLEDRLLQRDCSNLVGAALVRLGDLNTGNRYVEETYRLNMLLGDESGIIGSLINIGLLHFESQQFTLAVPVFEEALERSRASHDAVREIHALTNLGTARFSAFKDQTSLALMREAYARCTELGIRGDAARNLANLGEAMLELETPQAALEVLHQARAACLEVSNADAAASTLLYLGHAHIKLQEFSAARDFLEQGVREAQDLSHKALEIDFEKALCDLCIATQAYQEALKHHQRFYILEQKVRNENTDKATRAFEVQIGLEKARAETENHKARNLELAQALAALEASSREKTELLGQLRITTFELQQQVIRDPLTKLFNRRYLEERLTLEFQRASRTASLLPVAMLDIDNFKDINDTFSHHIGDQVLREIGVLLHQALRPSDLAARYGGEEFVIVLPNVLPQAAVVVCERLRKNVEQFNWHTIHPDLIVTVSIGIACDTTVQTHEKLLSLADEKMYQAKRSGKNRVCS